MNLGYAVAGITATGSLMPRKVRKCFSIRQTITVTGIKSTGQAVDVIRTVMTSDPVFVIRDDLPFTVTTVAASNDALVVKDGRTWKRP